MYRAGVTILAWMAANVLEHSPVSVLNGESPHRELELPVDAAISTANAFSHSDAG